MELADYKKYLARLVGLTYSDLAQKIALLDHLTLRASQGKDNFTHVNLFVPALISGLKYEVTFSLVRLVDTSRNTRSFEHFLKTTSSIFENVRWQNTFQPTVIEAHLALIENSEAVSRLKRRRNKFFAHYDTTYFADPSLIDVEFPFTIDDAKELQTLLTDIILFYHHALDGSQCIRGYDFVYYSEAQRLVEILLSQKLKSPEPA